MTSIFTGTVIPAPLTPASGCASTQIYASATAATTQSSWHNTKMATLVPNGNYTIDVAADLVLSTGAGSLSVNELMSFMETIKKRLLVLTPDFEKHEQYPALLAAYDHYCMVEKLCTTNTNIDKK
jgi:hypothetical protein